MGEEGPPAWNSPTLRPVPLTWLEGDRGPRERLQGAEGTPPHWGHRREELGPGQLPGTLEPARDLTLERPRPVWSRRDRLVHLHSHRPLWLLVLGPAVSSSHGRLAPWGTVMMAMVMIMVMIMAVITALTRGPAISPRVPIR